MAMTSIKVRDTKVIFEKKNKVSVIAELETSEMAKDVLKNGKKLHGTPIYIEKDLSLTRQENKSALLQLKRDLEANRKTHKIYVKNDSINISGKWMHFDKNKKLKCKDGDAVEQLKQLYEYNLHWVPATRTTNRGRASGGKLYGVRKQLQFCGTVVFKHIMNSTIIEITTNNQKLCLIPVYLNCNNWLNDINNLCEILVEAQNENVMIIGDFNARIGKEQCLEFHPNMQWAELLGHRVAMDTIVDRNGKQLLEICNSFGVTVLNGRTKGDREGTFTFIRGVARSTIDYCFVKGVWLLITEEFQIRDMIYSDHQPLEIMVNLDASNSNENKMQLLPKLIWKDKYKDLYQEKLEESLNACEGSTFASKEGDDILQYCVKQAAKSFQGNSAGINRKQKWYDFEYETARKKSFKWLQTVKKGGDIADLEKYKNVNREYKKLCDEKRKSYFNEMAMSISQAADNYIKGIKVDAEALAAHFKNQLNSNIVSKSFSYTLPYVINEALDAPIKIEEVYAVLQNLKNNKAAGENRIPAEFLKYATPQFIEHMAESYNYIFENAAPPDSYKKAITFPLFKKGDPNNVANYRGIAFLNTSAK
ncbi:uncharacterized protein LOC119663374, partial [Teleopsis dalmanni]|uniref:uncharacterized protein LOC119663374 n=1 Tax=Teleopsis dalmanni TaxID=139649 RepID=UPI0018CF149E